jgi:ABC-type multidrug transport system ATPase subunit
MDEAELCANLIFLNRGRIILRGSPGDMLKRYRRSLFDVGTSSAKFERAIAGAPGVQSVNLFGESYHVEAYDERSAIEEIRRALGEAGVPSASAQKIPPSLDDLFVSFASEYERGGGE